MIKNLLLRAITGAVYVAAILAGVLLGATAFQVLCLLLSVLATVEYSMCNYRQQCHVQGDDGHTAPKSAAVAAICIDTALAAVLTMADFLLIVPLLVLLLARMVYTVYSRELHPMASLARSMMGLLYIALPLLLLRIVYISDNGQIVLLMFLLIWLNDTGAYLVGVTCGRHSLAPRLSPKKSWEGFFGGLTFCVAAAVAAHFLGYDLFTGGIASMIGFGVLVCVFATWGDLLESLLKRTLGVKDSGRMLPGHGGILDRIDSLLMVAIATLAYSIILC